MLYMVYVHAFLTVLREANTFATIVLGKLRMSEACVLLSGLELANCSMRPRLECAYC
jgi:hypothetical protein